MVIACIFIEGIFCLIIGYLIGCAVTTDRFLSKED